MEKETVVDYMDAVEQYSRRLSPSRDELIVMPEPAGEPVVDYMAVSEKWTEEKGRMLRMLRIPRRVGD